MASVDSKFDDLSDAESDSLIDDATPKTPRQQLIGEYLFWKLRLRILNFSLKLVEVFLRVVNRFASFGQSVKSSLYYFLLLLFAS